MSQVDEDTILIVEDDRICARALTRLIGREYSVRAVTTKAEALKELERIDSFRAAVIDVQLPDGSGLDVLEEAHLRRPDLPVSVITAYLQSDVIQKIFSFDARFLAKPFSTFDLESLRDFMLGAAPSTVGRRLRLLASERGLTPMETEIVGLAANGFDKKLTARWLHLTSNDLNDHFDNILNKCDFYRLQDLVASLIRNEES